MCLTFSGGILLSDAGTEFLSLQNQFNGGFCRWRRCPSGDAGGHGFDVAAAHYEAGFGNRPRGNWLRFVVFGAVIGKLMVDGAAHQIAHTLLARKFSVCVMQLSVIIIGLIFGLAMFYEKAAFIMLAPLVIVIAAEAKIPFLAAIPAAATTAHSLFPPQPGPVALVNAYGADMGMVYIYGVVWPLFPSSCLLRRSDPAEVPRQSRSAQRHHS
ncbi:hypothetical protein [Escherichia coli]|uniref:GntT/GntP/DsdX family permease n=1 Tax=Escherichia coli TaxID=562 RepID=UPI003BF7453E